MLPRSPSPLPPSPVRTSRGARIVATAAAGAAGVVLGAAFFVVGRLRHAKPLHPVGVVVPATLSLTGSSDAPGARELGAPRDERATVRLSRSAGLPEGWPDVYGLAVRWTSGTRDQDLLLSSSGLGRWSRHLLTVRRSPLAAPFSTLMPFRGDDGPVVLAAVAHPADRWFARRDLDSAGSLTFELLSSRPGGDWHHLGMLTTDAVASPRDEPIRFDPVQHCPAGLRTYLWAALIRTPSYLAARRAWRVRS